MMSKTARLDLPRLSLETAEGPQKDILERAKKEVGFIPNMYAGWPTYPATSTSISSSGANAA